MFGLAYIVDNCPQSSSHLSGNPVCPVLGSVYWTSSSRAVLLACTPMRIGPSLYTSTLERIRSRSWLCDFPVIPSSRHSWTLFIRLSLTVPLLRSCCISYSIDALTRYSACRLICFSIDSLFLAPAPFGPTPVFFFLYPVILWSQLTYSLSPHNLTRFSSRPLALLEPSTNSVLLSLCWSQSATLPSYNGLCSSR